MAIHLFSRRSRRRVCLAVKSKDNIASTLLYDVVMCGALCQIELCLSVSRAYKPYTDRALASNRCRTVPSRSVFRGVGNGDRAADTVTERNTWWGIPRDPFGSGRKSSSAPCSFLR